MPPLLLSHYFAERYGLEIEVSLNGQSRGTADRLEIREGKISPLPLKPDHIAEEDEVVSFRRAFGDIPGQLASGVKSFA